ncbi:hypothetical protein FRC12_005682 [Ceratobasidium sp. 428]|nr:hypothetical protein FRC12_005682 [Ceratobasidium sp. 428]
MATLHRESCLPYAVWRGFQAQEAKSRKRKAPIDHAPSGPSRVKQQKKHPKLSADAELLLRLVDRSREQTLRRVLTSSITNASPEELRVARKLFGPLVSAAENPVHCVRCHESFIPHENNTGACKIPHLEPEWAGDGGYNDCDYPLSDDDEELTDMYDFMRYPCCGEQYREDHPDMVDEFCIRWSHTMDPNEVEYYVDPKTKGKGKKKPAYAFQYQRFTDKNPNVITCKQKKCPGA